MRVWCDKWIPKPTSYSVVTRADACPNVTLVCDLINRASMEWKVERIRGCFIEEGANAILSIPLCLHRPKDRLIWAESQSGKYTVKIAYRLAYEVNRGSGNADCSNLSTRKNVWKGLWRMNLPKKIKHFAWRAARNIAGLQRGASSEAHRGGRWLCSMRESVGKCYPYSLVLCSHQGGVEHE